MVRAILLTKAFQSGKYVSNLTRIHLVIVIMVKIASKKLCFVVGLHTVNWSQI